uniref:Bet v I/Major latex protein domain-containing protein n=1 Tax=Manihot esculenta TaxID=3983 RepID=A0A2C9W503_MANES
MAVEQNRQPKWKAKVTAKLTKAEPREIWPLFTDFFNLHKWLPTLRTCYGISGTNGEPGCIRYCSGSSIPSHNRSGDNNHLPVSWSTERLEAVDNVECSLRYVIVDSNIGFNSYVSTVRIVPVDGGGCVIEWWFEVNPVKGLVLEDLVSKYEAALLLMTRRMEDHLRASKQPPVTLSTEEREPKWEGKASMELKNATADQVWPFFEDFCNAHKWFPNLETSYQVEGELGKPGLVRYCASKPKPSSDATGGSIINWVKEKLIMINPVKRCMSYQVTETNMGFNSYTATIQVLPVNGDGAGGEHGCRIEWSFVVDPIEGWRLQDLESYINSTLQFMGNKMEQALSVSA